MGILLVVNVLLLLSHLPAHGAAEPGLRPLGSALVTNAVVAPELLRQQAGLVCAAARSRYLLDTNILDSAWRLAKAAFDYAEFSLNDTERSTLATEGIAVARQAVRLDSRQANAHYYLAMNLGQLARTKFLAALKLVGEMEREFQAAAGLDPTIDGAGPYRSLALLYRDAPGWPTSVGSKNKARQYFQKMLATAPGFPENQLCWLESLCQWKERAQFKAAFPKTVLVMQSAPAHYPGDAWAAAWYDWQQRWTLLRKRAGE
jgi:hypothetical protein